MCKAGFAGDDAPRAVFRTFPSPQSPLREELGPVAFDVDLLTYSPASIVGRPRHHGLVARISNMH